LSTFDDPCCLVAIIPLNAKAISGGQVGFRTAIIKYKQEPSSGWRCQSGVRLPAAATASMASRIQAAVDAKDLAVGQRAAATDNDVMCLPGSIPAECPVATTFVAADWSPALTLATGPIIGEILHPL
jgi:hypothetical protein